MISSEGIQLLDIILQAISWEIWYWVTYIFKQCSFWYEWITTDMNFYDTADCRHDMFL